MATEFKLSYTAEEVNSRLGKIDKLAEKSEIPSKISDLINDEGLATESYVRMYAQPVGDYALSSDIPNVPVKSVNGQIGAVSLNAYDVGALPDTTVIPSKVSDLTNDAGFITEYVETDPTVPAWAKAPIKPSYTASEVGALSDTTFVPSSLSDLSQDSDHKTVTDAEKDAWNAKAEVYNIPTKVSQLENDNGFLTEVPVTSVNGKTGAVQIEIPSIEGLATEFYVNEHIAAIPIPDVPGQINTHNIATNAHNDIRISIYELSDRLNALADSDDTTLDQMSEIVAYIKSNKGLIDEITTNKISVSDIIDNLTTNVSNKPLSAAQGVALKALIDAIVVPTKVSELSNDAEFATESYVTSYAQPIGDYALKNDIKVKSVNGYIGDVVLNASDVGALSANTVLPTVPTNVSAFTNDAGYLTQHQSLAEYVKTSDLGELATKDSVLKSDLASDILESLNKADSALQSYTETDPTVPDWAKEPNKPRYTADEVGALPNTTKIPTNVSELTNDAEFVTESYVESYVESYAQPKGNYILQSSIEGYIFNIDYDAILAFDTSEVIFSTNTNTNTSSVLGQAILGQMVLA